MILCKFSAQLMSFMDRMQFHKCILKSDALNTTTSLKEPKSCSAEASMILRVSFP